MNCQPLFMGMFIWMCSCCPALAPASGGGDALCAKAPFEPRNVLTAHNARTIWRRPNPMETPRRKHTRGPTHRLDARRDRQLRRCLDAEGKRATIERGRG